MTKPRKRKPDFRRIRPSHVYTLPEIVKDLDRNIATVRRWKKEGMPTLGDDKPTLVDGAELKAWLKQKWDAKKRPCGDGELYCCTCSGPRKPAKGSAKLLAKTTKVIIIKGVCSACGTRQSQNGSLAKIEEIRTNFGILTQHITDLVERCSPSVNDSNYSTPNSTNETENGIKQTAMDFTHQINSNSKTGQAATTQISNHDEAQL